MRWPTTEIARGDVPLPSERTIDDAHDHIPLTAGGMKFTRLLAEVDAATVAIRWLETCALGGAFDTWDKDALSAATGKLLAAVEGLIATHAETSHGYDAYPGWEALEAHLQSDHGFGWLGGTGVGRMIVDHAKAHAERGDPAALAELDRWNLGHDELDEIARWSPSN